MQHCTRVYCENLPLVSSYIIRFSQINQNGNVGKSTIFEFQFRKVFFMQIYLVFFKLKVIFNRSRRTVADPGFPRGTNHGLIQRGGVKGQGTAPHPDPPSLVKQDKRKIAVHGGCS